MEPENRSVKTEVIEGYMGLYVGLGECQFSDVGLGLRVALSNSKLGPAHTRSLAGQKHHPVS